jgi:hypothetical protein
MGYIVASFFCRRVSIFGCPARRWAFNCTASPPKFPRSLFSLFQNPICNGDFLEQLGHKQTYQQTGSGSVDALGVWPGRTVCGVLSVGKTGAFLSESQILR